MEKPILFSTPMVQAILAGRKKMTRRIMKIQPNENGASLMKNPPLGWEEFYKEEWKPWKLETEEGESIAINCPYGQLGDLLWVRETYSLLSDNPLPIQYLYKATDKPTPGTKWKPSIFMPREACRLFLRIRKIGVERLQDITESDAISEGVHSWVEERLKSKPTHYQVYYQDQPEDPSFYSSSAVVSFETLWQSINGADSWNLNPWVWVIEFERIDNPSTNYGN